jgi:hypothetical protein
MLVEAGERPDPLPSKLATRVRFPSRSTLDQRKRWVHDRNLRQHGTNEVYSRSMAGRPGTRTERGTGSIEKLPSGALRVRVYAGLDPLTKRRHELIEIIPPGPQAAHAAARLGHYFLGHAVDVFDQMGSDPVVEDARGVLDWISRTGAERFSRRDAFSGLSRARFRTVTDLEAPFTLLDAHGFIHRAAPGAPTGGRPSSPQWEVHPCAAKAAEAAEVRP